MSTYFMFISISEIIYVMPHMKRDHKAVLELYIPLESA